MGKLRPRDCKGQGFGLRSWFWDSRGEKGRDLALELAQRQGGPGLALGSSVGSGGPLESVGEEAQTERWQGSGFPTVLCAAVAWHRISNLVAPPQRQSSHPWTAESSRRNHLSLTCGLPRMSLTIYTLAC